MEKYKLGTVYQELENGINTDAGVHGSNLSLGMQKMTILLRGIFKQGKIFAFDEPLAGLDQETRKKVIKLIMEICKNKTVLIITHNTEILPYVDETIDISLAKKGKYNISSEAYVNNKFNHTDDNNFVNNDVGYECSFLHIEREIPMQSASLEAQKFKTIIFLSGQ